MIQQKENDWVLNLLNNQEFSVSDFKDVGLNADNTSLLSEDVYKQSKQIQDIFKKDDGTFDNETFHKFYENAELMYNAMSNDTMMESFNEQAAIYGKDNLFASDEQKRSFDETVTYNRVPNPDRTTTGLIRIGQTADPKYSQSELAQTQKVLTNPTEVYDSEGNPDWSKAEWHEAPNDSWFTDFFDTRVLAQWESDGEHIDPITGQKTKHQKGQLKLNEEGTYFYENLDGRDIYGKQVLNKMNTLTTDGSFWNEYDFFDSDDLKQKSIGGSLMKNAALVGSMFIPYVGPWIAGLSVASQVVGLLGTLGKMITFDSKSPIFSAMEGWSKSMNRQTAKSQYAIENTWCWENFINLIGDVAGQLKEQRFLFEFAPAIIKGNKVLGANGVSKTKTDLLIEKQTNALNALKQAKFNELQKTRQLTQAELANFQTSIAASRLSAAKDIENFTKSYYKVGEVLSKGYMTMLTVGDTYGDLKYEGKATDAEATWFTLGYAAAELAILNTDLGSWILPELKASRVKTKALIEAVAEVPEKYRIISSSMSKETKKDLAKYWFQKGKETFQQLQEGSASLIGQAVAGALGEGFEETTEELLGDFAKSCYNTYQWLNGSEKRVTAWNNILDRYSMSLIGGALGGGLTAVGTNFKTTLEKPSADVAMQQLVYMIREGEVDQIRKALDKTQLNDKNTSFESSVQSDGTVIDKPVTDKSKSKDAEIRKVFHQMINNIEAIIKSEGLDISDNAFIDKNTFNDIKLSVLQQSPVTGLLLQDFNSVTSKITSIIEQINTINASKKDGEEFTIQEQNQLNLLNEQLKNLRARKDAMLKGDLAMDYISASLFDLTKVISGKFGPVFFKDFVKHKHNVDVDILDEDTKKKYKKEYETWVNTEGKNEIYANASFFLNLAKNSKEFIQDFSANYDSVKSNTTIQNLYKSKIKDNIELSSIAATDTDYWLERFGYIQATQAFANLYALFNDNDLYSRHKDLTKGIGIESEIDTIQNNNALSEEDKEKAIEGLKDKLITQELLTKALLNLDSLFDDFTKAGVINPEIKNSLIDTLSYLETSVNKLDNIVDENFLNELDEDGITLYQFNPKMATDIRENLKIFGKDIAADKITTEDCRNFLKNKKAYIAKIQQKKRQLNSVGYTDIINFIDKFIKTNSDTQLDIAKLINTVNGLLYQNNTNLGNIDFSQFQPQLKEALKVLSWLEALVIAAQNDPTANLSNLVGFNVTLNEIAKKNGKDWEILPEISIANSNIILQDIGLIRSKLEQAQVLYSINENQKGLLIQKANDNLHIIHYKKLQKLIVNIDDDWVGKDKLKQVIDNAKTLASVNIDSISKEQKLKIIEESIAIDDALYDFFNANELSAEKIAKLLSKEYNCFDNSSILINADTQELSDRDFLFYLNSRAAIKKSEFIYEFRKVKNNEVAPFDIQEEAIFQSMAEILNKKTTNVFVEGLKLAAYNFWEKADRDTRLAILKNLHLSESLADIDDAPKTQIDILPKYSNIFLIEGLPGAGKTNAVTYYVSKILQEFHKDLISNAWAAHTSETTAESYAKNSLELDVKKHLDRHSLLKLIYIKYKIDRSQNDKGQYIYDSDEITDEGLFNDVSDSITNPPSIIFIDEISHYTQPELELLDDFAKKYNITIVTSGDFDQSTTEAEVTKNNIPYSLTNKPTLFKHSPKLGISIRTNNAQLDKTISLFRQRPQGKNKPIDTFYYEDSEIGLNGVKHTSTLEELEESIKNLLATSNGEKIGLIYYNDSSPLVKLIDDKYSNKFDKKKGTAAQGQEGQYYVVDLLGANDKDIYTGITRASQGVILHGNNIQVNSYREEETYTSSKKNFSGLIKDKMDYYDSLDLKKGIETSSSVKPKKRKASSETTVIVNSNIATEGGNWVNPDQIFSFDYSGKRYACDGAKVGEVISDDKIKILADDDPTTQYILDLYSNYEPDLGETPPTEEEIIEVQDIIYPENFNQLFHSFNTNQPGADVQENDKKKSPVLVGGHNKKHDWRIDGFIGIARVLNYWRYNSEENPGFKEGISYEQYEQKLDGLRNALLSYDDDTKLFQDIKYELNNGVGQVVKQIESIEFGIMSSPRINGNKEWGADESGAYDVFDRHKGEKGNNLKYDDLNRKTLGATIIVAGVDNLKKRLYVPLFVLGNLKTRLTNPDKSPFGEKLLEIYNNVGQNDYKFHKAVYEDTTLPKHVRHLAKLWTVTSGAWFPLSKDWRPRKKLKNWGIQVNTNAISGTKYPHNGAGTFTPIRTQQKNGIRFSRGIYSANRNVDINGTLRPIAKRGHSFIFTTQNPTIIDDKAMLDKYIEQLKDPTLDKDVTLVYISTPKVPIKKYLTNLHNLLHKKSTKRLGNNFTSFRIWEALLQKDETLTSFNLNLTEDQINFIKEQVNKIKSLSSKEDQKNALLSTTEFQKAGTKTKSSQSVRGWLNHFLNQVFVSEINKENIDNNALTNLASAIESVGISEIHYSHKFKEIKDSAGPISEMEQDFDGSGNPTYQIDGLDFTCNAKLDSYMFEGDFSEELEYINENITNDVPPRSKASDDFVNWPIKINKKPKKKTTSQSSSTPASGIIYKTGGGGTTVNGYSISYERFTGDIEKVFIQTESGLKEITGISYGNFYNLIKIMPYKKGNVYKWDGEIGGEFSLVENKKLFYDHFNANPQLWIDDTTAAVGLVIANYNKENSNKKIIIFQDSLREITLNKSIALSPNDVMNLMKNITSEESFELENGSTLTIKENPDGKIEGVITEPTPVINPGTTLVNKDGIRLYDNEQGKRMIQVKGQDFDAIEFFTDPNVVGIIAEMDTGDFSNANVDVQSLQELLSRYRDETDELFSEDLIEPIPLFETLLEIQKKKVNACQV